jgi:uncharacterized protein (TIGR03435 family)
MSAASVVFAVFLFCDVAGAQAASQVPQFEVASVKISEPGTRPTFPGLLQGGPGTKDPSQITYSRVTLRTLLTTAFGVANEQISGPDFIDTDRFDVVAKLHEGATVEELRLLLQNLLSDRFKLASHRQAKDLPVYALIPAKGGPKMQRARGAGEPNCVVRPVQSSQGETPRQATFQNAIAIAQT